MGTIAEKLQKLIETKEAIKSAIKSKGQTLEDSEPLSAYPNKILAIETGAQLPSLSNPASAAQILEGYEAIDGTGAKITGSIQDVVQATPSITVSDKGLITASTTQSAGYIAAGKKSATKQLTAQAAQTITPGTTDQTIASGRYLTGAQTIKGDANLIPANIKSGVSIFGVTGTLEPSSGSKTVTVTLSNDAAIKLVIVTEQGRETITSTTRTYQFTALVGGLVVIYNDAGSEFNFSETAGHGFSKATRVISGDLCLLGLKTEDSSPHVLVIQ